MPKISSISHPLKIENCEEDDVQEKGNQMFYIC